MQMASIVLPRPKHMANAIFYVLLLLLTVTTGALLIYLMLLKPLFMLLSMVYTHYVLPYLPDMIHAVQDFGNNIIRSLQEDFFMTLALLIVTALFCLVAGLLCSLCVLVLFAFVGIVLYVVIGRFVVFAYIFTLVTVFYLTLVISGIIVEHLLDGCKKPGTSGRIQEVACSVTRLLWHHCWERIVAVF